MTKEEANVINYIFETNRFHGETYNRLKSCWEITKKYGYIECSRTDIKDVDIGGMRFILLEDEYAVCARLGITHRVFSFTGNSICKFYKGNMQKLSVQEQLVILDTLLSMFLKDYMFPLDEIESEFSIKTDEDRLELYKTLYSLVYISGYRTGIYEGDSYFCLNTGKEWYCFTKSKAEVITDAIVNGDKRSYLLGISGYSGELMYIHLIFILNDKVIMSNKRDYTCRGSAMRKALLGERIND